MASVNSFTRLYPGTTPLYWSFLGLNLSGQLAYLIRDAYRNEVVVPQHRYLDYQVKGFIGAIITTYSMELSNRIAEAMYFAPAAARHAFKFNQELSENYLDPETLAKGSSAKNISTLGKSPYMLGKMSGSFANTRANPELADNLLHQFLNEPHLVPDKERASILHFWRKSRFFTASDSSSRQQHNDFLKLVVDKNHAKPELLKYIKPDTLHQLPTEQLNELRDVLLQNQLIRKLLRLSHTPTGDSKTSLKRDELRHFFKTMDLDRWLDNEVKLSKVFKDGLTQPKSAIVGLAELSSDSRIKEFDSFLKSSLNNFNYFTEASVVDGNATSTRKIFHPYLASNKINNIRRVLHFVRNEILRPGSDTQISVGKNKLLQLSPQVESRLQSFLESPLESLKVDSKDTDWLKRYLKEGMDAHHAKKILSRINKHDFFLKMVTLITIQFFVFGMFTTLMDVDVAQPLQKKLTAMGIRPDKVSRWPIYSSVIPGALSFMAFMSRPIMAKVPVIGKHVNGMSRIGRFLFAAIPSAAVTAATMIGGIRKNIRESEAEALKTHKVHQPLPAGMAEERLLKLGYSTFAQRGSDNPFANQQRLAPSLNDVNVSASF